MMFTDYALQIGIVCCLLALCGVAGLNITYGVKEWPIEFDQDNDPLYFWMTISGIICSTIGCIYLLIYAINYKSSNGYEQIIDEEPFSDGSLNENFKLVNDPKNIMILIRDGYDYDNIISPALKNPLGNEVQIKTLANIIRNSKEPDPLLFNKIDKSPVTEQPLVEEGLRRRPSG